MALTDWQQPTSEGVLPNDQRARQFRYRAFLDFQIPSLVIGTSFSNLSAEWKVNLMDGETVIFSQEVRQKFLIVFLGFFGLISFFTWSGSTETITTHIVDGMPITEENPAWGYTLGNSPLSEFGTLETGGGGSYTDQWAYIQDWWDSPIYNMTVPVGCTWDVEYMRLTSGGVTPNTLAFEFSFELGGTTPVYRDRDGALRTMQALGGDLHFAHTYSGPGARKVRSKIEGVSDAFSWRGEGQRSYVVARKNEAWRVWYSDNDGLTNAPLMATGGEQVAFWQSGDWRNVDAKPCGSGMASCAMMGDYVYFMLTRDMLTPGTKRRVSIPHNNKPVYVVVSEPANGQSRITLTDNDEYQVESNDGGATWAEFDEA